MYTVVPRSGMGNLATNTIGFLKANETYTVRHAPRCNHPKNPSVRLRIASATGMNHDRQRQYSRHERHPRKVSYGRKCKNAQNSTSSGERPGKQVWEKEHGPIKAKPSNKHLVGSPTAISNRELTYATLKRKIGSLGRVTAVSARATHGKGCKRSHY